MSQKVLVWKKIYFPMFVNLYSNFFFKIQLRFLIWTGQFQLHNIIVFLLLPGWKVHVTFFLDKKLNLLSKFLLKYNEFGFAIVLFCISFCVGKIQFSFCTIAMQSEFLPNHENHLDCSWPVIKDDQNKPIVIRRTDKSYLKSNNTRWSNQQCTRKWWKH